MLGQVQRDITDNDGKIIKTIYPYRYTLIDHNDLDAGIRFYDAPSSVSEAIDDGIEYNGSFAFVLKRKGSSQTDTRYTVLSISKDQELDISKLDIKDRTVAADKDNKSDGNGNGSAKEEAE